MYLPSLRSFVVFGTLPFLTAPFLGVAALGQRKSVSLESTFCADFPSAKSSCESFKELVDRKDKDPLAILGQRCRVNSVGVGRGASEGAAYACFVESEDRYADRLGSIAILSIVFAFILLLIFAVKNATLL